MLNRRLLGKYYPIDSKIHDMSSISKILSLFIFLLIMIIVNNIWLYVLLTIFTFVLILISKVPWWLFINGLKNLRILIIIVFILGYIFSFNLLTPIMTVLRIVLIVMYTSILTFTTTPSEITDGLERIFKPLKRIKVPVSEIALSLSLALKFIPIILEQTNKILKSQASRGVDFKCSNLKGKLIALSSMITPMFILSFKRAGELADTMEVRLYGYSENRTNYRLKRWREHDNTMVIMHLALLVVIILSEVVR